MHSFVADIIGDDSNTLNARVTILDVSVIYAIEGEVE